MCGIFGTTNPKADLIPLIRDNMERGAQAISFFSPNYRLVYENPSGNSGMWLPVNEPWVLGHCQATTGTPNSDRHPFQWRDWFVAHNGVIHQSFTESDDWPWDTDSSVIANRLHYYGLEGALSGLDGTFACWAHNFAWKQTYLFSWVNPIYATATAFSSKPIKEAGTPLQEGSVFKWPGERKETTHMVWHELEEVARFSCKSHPYKKVSSPKSSPTTNS
jgi:hypothetical protein